MWEFANAHPWAFTTIIVVVSLAAVSIVEAIFHNSHRDYDNKHPHVD